MASDGGIFSFGDAKFYGSTGAMSLNRPIVGMAATATGRGYWLAGSDGGVFSFGNARPHGSLGRDALSRNIVAIDGALGSRGYLLVTAGPASAPNPLPSGPFAMPTAALKGVFPAAGAPRIFVYQSDLPSVGAACDNARSAAVAAGYSISPFPVAGMTSCSFGIIAYYSFSFEHGSIHGSAEASSTYSVRPSGAAPEFVAVVSVKVG